MTPEDVSVSKVSVGRRGREGEEGRSSGGTGHETSQDPDPVVETGDGVSRTTDRPSFLPLLLPTAVGASDTFESPSSRKPYQKSPSPVVPRLPTRDH